MDVYTAPNPAQRDIDIVDVNPPPLLGNCSPFCNGTDEALYHWTWTSGDILHIAFPVMIGWGVLTGFTNIFVLQQHIKAANDSYLLGFVTSSILLLCSGGLLHLEDYVGLKNECQYMYGYVRAFHSWFWYTCLWILLIMSLERCLILTQNRSKSLCTPCQASVVTTIIYIVTFLSALPQFWEYEAKEALEIGTNRTIVLSQPSKAASMPEYQIMYFWYRTSATLFFPFPTLLVMCCILCKQLRRSNRHFGRLSIRQHTGNSMTQKVNEENHMTRLFIVNILLYLILTGPYSSLDILERTMPWLFERYDILFKGLSEIFEFAFYFYFAIQFFLYCSYSDSYRESFVDLCCCCCRRSKKTKRGSIKKETTAYTPAVNGRVTSRPDTKYFIT